MPAPDWSLLLRTPAFEITAFLLGLVVGSFANVCIHRLPRDFEPATGAFAWAIDLVRQASSVVHPPSHCPRCKRRIRATDNVPLLSYAVLGGRCRDCREPIPWRYPAVEAANGLLWLAVALVYGASLQALVWMGLATALLVLGLIDLEHQLLPDAVTLPGTVFGVAASFLPGARVAPLASLAAAAGGWLVFAGFALAWRKLRGIDALGQGDWKMAAMLGAFFGWERLLLTVLLATATGSLVGLAILSLGKGGLRSKLPLGTFLAVAGLAMVLGGEELLAGYRRAAFPLSEALVRRVFGG